MLWFKHDANSRDDARLKLLMTKYGLEGYAAYFIIVETIAKEAEPGDPDDTLGVLDPDIYSVEFMAQEMKIEPDMLREMYQYMVKIGLFDREKWESGVIANYKVIGRADNYFRMSRRKMGKEPLSRWEESKEYSEILEDTVQVELTPDLIGELQKIFSFDQIQEEAKRAQAHLQNKAPRYRPKNFGLWFKESWMSRVAPKVNAAALYPELKPIRKG